MLSLCGVRYERDLLGLRSKEFFATANSERGEKEEQNIMRTRAVGREHLSFIERKCGPGAWLVSRRWPIRSDDGVVGVVGVGRVLDAPKRFHPMYSRLCRTIDVIHSNYGEKLDIQELARHSGVSIARLEQDFVACFGAPPRDYVTKVRLESAMRMLQTDASIAVIAHACGYADQSAFTRRFRATVGMTPSEYRKHSRA
jgi:AraC-like DNA-binding protein